MGSARGLEVPTGDFRLVADLDAAAIDGPWAWAPGRPVRHRRRAVADLLAHVRAAHGAARRRARVPTCEATFETEFTSGTATAGRLHEQPAYGIEATRAAGPFLLALVRRLRGARHRRRPGASRSTRPGQLEVSVGVHRAGRGGRPGRAGARRDPHRRARARPAGVAVGQADARCARQRRAPAPVAVARRRQPVRQRRRRARHGARGARLPGGPAGRAAGAGRRRLRQPGLLPPARPEPLDGRLSAAGASRTARRRCG